LRGRICGDHLSAEKQADKDFRGKLAAEEGLTDGYEVQRWLCENCSISWIEIPSPGMHTLVESLLIAGLRIEKQPLLNK